MLYLHDEHNAQGNIIYNKLQEQEKNNQTDPTVLHIEHQELSSTKDIKELLTEQISEGKWKRLHKKTLGSKYKKRDFRTFHNPDTNQTVTVASTKDREYKPKTIIYDFNLQQELDTINKIIEFSQLHYADEDSGFIYYHPTNKILIYSFSDCFPVYCNNTKNKNELKEQYELSEMGEHANWTEEPNNWPQTHIPNIQQCHYVDEASFNTASGYILIGEITEIDYDDLYE